jgi:hypothetical protein
VGVSAGRDAALTVGGYGDEVSEDPAADPLLGPEFGEPALGEPELTSAYPQPRPMPYGSSPYAVAIPAFDSAPAAQERSIVEWADVWTVLLGTAGVVVLGVVAAFLWVWLSPRTNGQLQGNDIAFSANVSKVFAGADVVFLFITVGAGLVCGVVAAIVARHRGLAVSLAMAIGGTLASLEAAWIGRALTGGPEPRWVAHASKATHPYFIALATRQYIVAWPLTALLVTFVVGLFTPDQPREIVVTEPAPAESAPT